jgi:hypothetical protein
MAKKVSRTKRHKVGGLKRKKARRVYNPQTGKIGGRAANAQPRLDALTKKYQDQGLPLEEARQRARAEMRDNTRGDWRDG